MFVRRGARAKRDRGADLLQVRRRIKKRISSVDEVLQRLFRAERCSLKFDLVSDAFNFEVACFRERNGVFFPFLSVGFRYEPFERFPSVVLALVEFFLEELFRAEERGFCEEGFFLSLRRLKSQAIASPS